LQVDARVTRPPGHLEDVVAVATWLSWLAEKVLSDPQSVSKSDGIGICPLAIQ
jgi:hypothetical protein